ncbi:MAG: alpha/beta hydrolase [Candidatus Promineifilaceae bacterium]
MAALAPLLLYLGRLVLSQNGRIFRPGPLLPYSPADYGMRYETIPLGPAGAAEGIAWWLPQPAARQAVIFFHGSDGNLSHELPTLRFLHQLPANVLAVEYPGYAGGRTRPSERGCYQAAEAGWRIVTGAKGIAPEQVILLGHSLGSAVAVYLAARVGLGGLVIQSGFTSVPDMAALAFRYLPARLFVWTKMNSQARLAGCRCPVLILHSADDEHIPVAHAQRLFQASPVPKKLLVFRGPHFGSHWLRLEQVQAAWRELLAREFSSWQTA